MDTCKKRTDNGNKKGYIIESHSNLARTIYRTPTYFTAIVIDSGQFGFVWKKGSPRSTGSSSSPLSPPISSFSKSFRVGLKPQSLHSHPIPPGKYEHTHLYNICNLIQYNLILHCIHTYNMCVCMYLYMYTNIL